MENSLILLVQNCSVLRISQNTQLLEDLKQPEYKVRAEYCSYLIVNTRSKKNTLTVWISNELFV